MTSYTIEFEPVGRRGLCSSEKSLLSCSHQLGVRIMSLCGGQGTCQSCKVQVLSGTTSKPTSREHDVFSPQEIKSGWRLACQTYPTSNCKLNIPAESMSTPQRTQVEGKETVVKPKPSTKTYHINLPQPSMSDLEGDADRLLELLNQQYKLNCHVIDIDVLHTLSSQLREWNWECQATIRNNELVAIGPWSTHHLGLAIDLGTTKIAGYLVDLNTGKTLAAKGIMNPQISYGEDIISRITGIINAPEKGIQLQQLAVEALNQLAADLCAEVSASTKEIVEAVIAGNTAMHHLFAGLPVKQLALSPFVPAISKAIDIKSRDLGLLIAPGAYVHLLPNIAGFVGADHVAMLLATRLLQTKGLVIALDIGTNTECSLASNGTITSVSCASGPAFEGSHIKHGMRAASGAIERLQIQKDTIKYHTIDHAPPTGICGSGILDAVAQLYMAGIINEGGRMKDRHPRIRTDKNQREFVIVDEDKRNGHPAVTITQKDIREVQLAKSAIRTGIHVLLEAAGRCEEEIDQIIIAGAFGNYIDISSAMTIGMLPSLPLDRFRQVGNAAGMGAKMALISTTRRKQAQTIASKVKYIELASAPDFTETFVQSGYLGHYRLSHGKRRKIDF